MTVGAQLRQARSERKLSLAEVTKQTKIQPWVLEALEADRLLEQMSPVYVKGFLATYARYLRLPPEPLIVQLLPPPPPPVEHRPTLPPAEPLAILRRLSLPPAVSRRLMAVVVACAVVAGLVVVNPLRWLSRVRLPTGNMPAMASVAQGLEPAAKAPTLKTVALLPSQPLELMVSAGRTTWIQLRADGKLLTQQRLKRGANERWTANKRFELVVANPSQIELTLNGQPISSFAIAHEGRLLITHQGVTRLPDEE